MPASTQLRAVATTEVDDYFVANLSDQSTFLSPSLTYSFQSNLDLTFGLRWLQGRTGTEYGSINDMYDAVPMVLLLWEPRDSSNL